LGGGGKTPLREEKKVGEVIKPGTSGSVAVPEGEGEWVGSFCIRHLSASGGGDRQRRGGTEGKKHKGTATKQVPRNGKKKGDLQNAEPASSTGGDVLNSEKAPKGAKGNCVRVKIGECQKRKLGANGVFKGEENYLGAGHSAWDGSKGGK